MFSGPGVWWCGLVHKGQQRKNKTRKNLESICTYLVIFESTQGRLRTRPFVVKTLWWADSVGTERTRSLEQQISPVLEITETQHPHPLVGLFVHLSEGQSAAADRCVCSRFLEEEAAARSVTGFPTLSALEGRQGSSQDVPDWPFLTSHLV